MIKKYKVGGVVRDAILGIKSKDIDYAVVAGSFQEMKDYIISNGGKIYEEKPEYATIRANMNNEAVDFVLARKDGVYSDGRRPDSIEAGTLMDDLSRRDFTMNAIAIDEDGKFIDPFDGRGDIQRKIIRCVGNTYQRMNEDYLRMLRAIRFSITKGFVIDSEISRLFSDRRFLDGFANSIPEDRVRDELTKMFTFDTRASIQLLASYPLFNRVIFNTGVWVVPTSKQNEKKKQEQREKSKEKGK